LVTCAWSARSVGRLPPGAMRWKTRAWARVSSPWPAAARAAMTSDSIAR